MEAVRTSESSVDYHFTRQYIPEDNSEHHTRRRENLKSHKRFSCCCCRWGQTMSLNCGHRRAYCSPQVIHENGELWWDVDREKLIRPPQLSGNPTRRVI
jgi:hypothetical protein